MDYRNYSFPIGPNGRDFAFALPDDLTADEAELIAQFLPAIVRRAQSSKAVDIKIEVECSPRVLKSTGDKRRLLSHEVDEFLKRNRSGNGHVEDADTSVKPVDEKPESSTHAPNPPGWPEEWQEKPESPSVAAPPVVVDAKPKARWSRDHDRCVNPNCTAPNSPHEANGKCKSCYNSERKKKSRAAKRDAAKKPDIGIPITQTVQESKTNFDMADVDGRKAVDVAAEMAGIKEAKAELVQKTQPLPTVAIEAKPTPTVVAPKPSETNGKPPWPLRNITRDEAVRIVELIAPKLKTSMTLDEMALNVGANVDDVGRVYDTFRTDIDRANSYGGNTAEIFKQALERRYGAW